MIICDEVFYSKNDELATTVKKQKIEYSSVEMNLIE